MPWQETHNHKDDSPLFVWAYRSDRINAAGAEVKYTLKLFKDGCMGCDCPGWTFRRKDKLRGCKHVAANEAEALALLKKWKRGEKLPVLDQGLVPALAQSLGKFAPKGQALHKNAPAPEPTLFGRVLDL